MRIPNKLLELQEVASNYSSDINFIAFMNPYKKCTEKAYFFLVNHTTLKLDKPLRFKNNLLQIL